MSDLVGISEDRDTRNEVYIYCRNIPQKSLRGVSECKVDSPYESGVVGSILGFSRLLRETLNRGSVMTIVLDEHTVTRLKTMLCLMCYVQGT